MNHQYEERLGTDRMLPLIFKMALPAVIAQIIMASTESMAGFALGFVPIVSYNYGHGNRERVKDPACLAIAAIHGNAVPSSS